MFDDITVLFGSQTGTAEDVARYICRLLHQSLSANNNAKCVAQLFSCDEFLGLNQDSTIKKRLILLVCATTGNGDPPENMRFFWRNVMSKRFDPGLLFGDNAEISFAVLGLGDSTYERFNFVAKKLERRFEQIFQVDPFVALGLADDQDRCGLYTVADSWINSLFEKLELPIPTKDSLPNLRFKIRNSINDNGDDAESQMARLLEFPCDSTRASLTACERITAHDHFQDVRLVRLKTKDIIYYPGDVCYIQPGNSTEQINCFLSVFDLPLDYKVQIEQNNRQNVQLTVRDLVHRYFNLFYVPFRTFYDMLGRFTSDSMEKERMQELASNYDDLLDYSLRPKRNVVEVFGDFRQTTEQLRKLPIDQLLAWLLELIPPIRARAFSIASAQVEVGAEIQLLVAIVQYQTKIRKPRQGLCTSWLIELKADGEENYNIPVWIRPSSMRFPIMRPAPSTEPFPPMIMIGPGTGLAPFRAYIQYRNKLADVYGSDVLWANGSNMWLLFGCRFEGKDFLCGEELISFKKKDLLRLDLAFSRDGPEKVYVQHKIRASEADIGEWILKRGAHICIAGNAVQMPKDVKEALRDCLVGHGMLETLEDAKAYMEQLEKSGRLVVETWS